jgi:hypothetical protein
MPEPRAIIAIAVEGDDEFVWNDLLRDIQFDLFAAGPLAIKVCYFGVEDGLPRRPLMSTRWARDSDDLQSLLDHARNGCVCGCYVNIGDVLVEALREQEPLQAIAIVGDCFRGDRDETLAHAKQLRALGTRLFLFEQKGAARSSAAFRALAEVTGGAVIEFDPAVERVAERLPKLFEAIAHCAVGGPDALRALADPSAELLLEQMSRKPQVHQALPFGTGSRE